MEKLKERQIVRILGLSVDVPTCTSAILLKNGEVIAGSPEERLNRKKWSSDFPSKAIQYCLGVEGIKMNNIDGIAVSWNPLINLTESSSARLLSTGRHKGELLYSVPANLLKLTDLSVMSDEHHYLKQTIAFEHNDINIYYIKHHTCHAAHSFFESPFDEAVILTCDGYGENETLTVSIGEKNNIKRVSTTYFPHSLGMFYGTITEYLGYQHDSDEWKVMALGAFGEFDKSLYEKLYRLFSVQDDLSIKIDTSVFQFNNILKKGMFDKTFENYIGIPPRTREDAYSIGHYNLAFAAQKVFEDVLFDLIIKTRKKFKMKNICLGGGSFMNSLFNGKLAHSNIFENIYIPFAPSDAGCAIGAASYLYYHVMGHERKVDPLGGNPYLGPLHSDDKIEKALKLFKCNYSKPSNLLPDVAKLIAEGSVVGWFQGRMEFGDRALGNRSILADPRNPDSKEKVNAIIKFREAFRPFAPSILSEYVEEYFSAPERNACTPYMEKVFNVRKDKISQIPSVVHADGTGRLQSVDRQRNAKYYELIDAFHKLTGVPIVMNTSLNRNGEPVVCSPEDALNVFYGSGLDYLVLGSYIVRK